MTFPKRYLGQTVLSTRDGYFCLWITAPVLTLAGPMLGDTLGHCERI